MLQGKQDTISSLVRRTEIAAKGRICSSETFHTLLRHERARVDRDGAEFSLVIIPVESCAPFIQPICNAMRSIDVIGRLDADTIGVLLPVTTLEGGLTFARRAFASLDLTSAAPPFEVYAYPRHWFPVAGDFIQPNTKDELCIGNEVLPRLPEVLEKVFRRRIPGWKRLLDVGGSLFAFALFAPLFLLIPSYIKLMSRGPIFFRHQRVGYRGRMFNFLKFRTMSWGNDQNTHKNHIITAIRSGRPLEKLDDKSDPRIIPGGRILRKTCIDELPQLINVLRGEMSLVGPRPCMPYEAAEFLRWHTHRFDVLPGMTGLWQVSGKNKLSFSQMIRLDISYVEHLSFWRDVRILLATFPAIGKMVFEAVAGKLSPARTRDAADGAVVFPSLPERSN